MQEEVSEIAAAEITAARQVRSQLLQAQSSAEDIQVLQATESDDEQPLIVALDNESPVNGTIMSPDEKNRAIEPRLTQFQLMSRLDGQSKANSEYEWPDLHEMIDPTPPSPPPVVRKEFYNDLEVDKARLSNSK